MAEKAWLDMTLGTHWFQSEIKACPGCKIMRSHPILRHLTRYYCYLRSFNAGTHTVLVSARVLALTLRDFSHQNALLNKGNGLPRNSRSTRYTTTRKHSVNSFLLSMRIISSSGHPLPHRKASKPRTVTWRSRLLPLGRTSSMYVILSFLDDLRANHDDNQRIYRWMFNRTRSNGQGPCPSLNLTAGHWGQGGI